MNIYYLYSMGMIPYDVLHLIVEYASLADRYRWSIVHQRFLFTREDWLRQSMTLGLVDESKKLLKRLLARDYDNTWSISRHPRHIWSNNLREPLQVWTPWTIGSLCDVRASYTKMWFRESRFISFVQNVANMCSVRTPCIGRHRSVRCVWSILWTKTRKSVPMVYISRGKRRCRLHVSCAFKMRQRDQTRALIQFRVHDNSLKLYIQRLEFLV